jgi:ubiquitin
MLIGLNFNLKESQMDVTQHVPSRKLQKKMRIILQKWRNSRKTWDSKEEPMSLLIDQLKQSRALGHQERVAANLSYQKEQKEKESKLRERVRENYRKGEYQKSLHEAAKRGLSYHKYVLYEDCIADELATLFDNDGLKTAINFSPADGEGTPDA